MSNEQQKTLRVGVLGAGTVGSQTVRQLIERKAELEQRIGGSYEIVGVAVRNLTAQRDPAIPRDLLTTDANAVIDASDIVIELIGGIEPAKTYIERALSSGKDVITGNKALLSEHQTELFAVGQKGNAETYYEAAVAAAIPILRPLQDSLVGDKITRVMGIVNGSTNYILDQIDSRGISMEQALTEASELGYLEADPSADVDGYDAASKATILAGLAFHTHVPADAVYREGIGAVTSNQIAAAKAAGYVVKLLAIAERLTSESGTETVNVRVYPALIPRDHPLAAVRGGKNAVFVEAEAAGDLMFYGAGAGGVETSSAVLGDFVLAAKRIRTGAPAQFITFDAHLGISPIDDVLVRYQITLEVDDRPGVLATVAEVISAHGVSVRAVSQSQNTVSEGGATLIVETHSGREGSLRDTVNGLATCESVRAVTAVLRVEGA